MHDVVVVEQLRNRGLISRPYSELLPYEAMERRARILDKPPKQITLSRVGEINPCGTAQKFIMIYNQLVSEGSLEMGTIDIKGAKRYCDVSVFYTLQTLIRLSMGKSLDLVKAACDVFKLIITHPCETLTEGVMYNLLRAYIPMNYYAGELVNGILIAVYKEESVALYWKSLCEFMGFYTDAIEPGMAVIKENCKNEKEVRSFLTKIYKEAKADEAFMSKLYKPAVNKWLVAMLYYLYPTKPELIDLGIPESVLKSEEDRSCLDE